MEQATADKMIANTAEKRATAPVPLDEVHIDDLLREVVERGGSDLHVCVGVPPVIRVDGHLSALNYAKFTQTDTQRMLYDILSDEQIQRFEEQWELDFSYSLESISRFRVNIFKDKGTLASAFRLIPMKIPTIKEWDFHWCSKAFRASRGAWCWSRGLPARASRLRWRL